MTKCSCDLPDVQMFLKFMPIRVPGNVPFCKASDAEIASGLQSWSFFFFFNSARERRTADAWPAQGSDFDVFPQKKSTCLSTVEEEMASHKNEKSNVSQD